MTISNRDLSGMSFDSAESAYRYGRVTEKQWKAYKFFWIWTAPRFSHLMNADRKHDRAFKKLGRDAYYRRIERAKELCESWKNL